MEEYTDQPLGLKHLLIWAGKTTGIPCSRAEDLRDGLIIGLLLCAIWPSLKETKRIKFKRAQSDWELKVNWDSIHAIAVELKLPTSVMDRFNIQSGRFRYVYNSLVMLYFLYHLSRNKDFSVDFAHRIDDELASFLQSSASIESLVRGGALSLDDPIVSDDQLRSSNFSVGDAPPPASFLEPPPPQQQQQQQQSSQFVEEPQQQQQQRVEEYSSSSSHVHSVAETPSLVHMLAQQVAALAAENQQLRQQVRERSSSDRTETLLNENTLLKSVVCRLTLGADLDDMIDSDESSSSSSSNNDKEAQLIQFARSLSGKDPNAAKLCWDVAQQSVVNRMRQLRKADASNLTSAEAAEQILKLKRREKFWMSLVQAQQQAIKLTEELAETDNYDRLVELNRQREALDLECSRFIEELNILADSEEGGEGSSNSNSSGGGGGGKSVVETGASDSQSHARMENTISELQSQLQVAQSALLRE